MELSVKTVKNHLTALYRALKVVSRLEAPNYAMRHPEVLAATTPETHFPQSGAAVTLTVMLVDDNARYRQQLGRLISKSYPTALVYEAEDIGEALRLTERIRPQLVLVDVVLTEKDGIQCTRRIKAISPLTRVVLISSYVARDFRRLGLSAGPSPSPIKKTSTPPPSARS